MALDKLAAFAQFASLAPWHPSRVHTSMPEPYPVRVHRLRLMWERSQAAIDRVDYLTGFAEYCANHDGNLSDEVVSAFQNFAVRLALQNRYFIPEFPSFPTHSLTAIEADSLEMDLTELERRLVNETKLHDEFLTAIVETVTGLTAEFPFGAASSSLTIPLHDLVDMGPLVDRLLHHFLVDLSPKADTIKAMAISHTANQLWRNLLDASNISEDDVATTSRSIRRPSESKLSSAEIVRTYFAHTPLVELFDTAIPFTIAEQAWTEHAFIAAPSGHGKTQLLQTLILDFLEQPDPPGMFIIDDQDDANGILNKIQRLAVFDEHLRDRLLILSPEDLPALNFFEIQGEMTPDVISTFVYLFSALDSSLSTNQSTAVVFLIRLIHKIPGANLTTLLDIMQSPAAKYSELIQQLDPVAKAYFETQFFSSGLKVTKEAVARRLFALMANPSFVEMFNAPTNCFDAARCMREKKIVLINASARKLGDASTVYARFFISQILAAAVRRGEDTERPLSLLIIDEAGPHLDSQTERLLAVARKYQLGLIAATQMLEQIDQKVKAALYAGTRIKFVGPVSYSDSSILAREMYTNAEFIRSTTKTATGAQWSCFVRGETPKPVKLSIPFGKLEGAAQMSAKVHKAMRAKNRARVHAHDAPAIMTATMAAPATPTAVASTAAAPTSMAAPADPSKPVDGW